MADPATKTTNLSLQRIGGAEVIAPDDYNTMLDLLDSNLPGSSIVAATYATLDATVAGTSSGNIQIQKLRLTLTAAVVSATNANKYGSLLLLTWPNSNIKLVRARMNLVGTKDGTQIATGDQPTVALGSAAASNTTLSSTMIDTTDILTLATGLTPAAQKNGNATQADRNIAAGATNRIYLNIGATGNTGGGTGNVSFAGTIDLYFIDLGTFS